MGGLKINEGLIGGCSCILYLNKEVRKTNLVAAKCMYSIPGTYMSSFSHFCQIERSSGAAHVSWKELKLVKNV